MALSHWDYCLLIRCLFIYSPTLGAINDEGLNSLVNQCEFMTTKEKKLAKEILKELRDTAIFKESIWFDEDNLSLFVKILKFARKVFREMRGQKDNDELFANLLEEQTEWLKDEPEQKYLNMCKQIKEIKEYTEFLGFNCQSCNPIGSVESGDLVLIFLPCGFHSGR